MALSRNWEKKKKYEELYEVRLEKGGSCQIRQGLGVLPEAQEHQEAIEIFKPSGNVFGFTFPELQSSCTTENGLKKAKVVMSN